jgi:hypothetical protein
MPLIRLPTEIILCVIDVLSDPNDPRRLRNSYEGWDGGVVEWYSKAPRGQLQFCDIRSLALTCRHFHSCLAPVLDKLFFNAAQQSENDDRWSRSDRWSGCGPYTFLQFAARKNKLAPAQRLLSLGVNPNYHRHHPQEWHLDFYGAYLTPITLAARSGNKEMVDLLLTHGAIPEQDKEEKVPLLHRAAQRGWVDIVEKLCKSGTDVNLITTAPQVRIDSLGYPPTTFPPTRGGINALFFAAESMAFGAVAKLIQLGADVNAKDAEGQSLLHYLRGHDDATAVEVARLFLDAGVEVNGWMPGGMTPLHLVAMWGLFETARLLLERGAECSAADVRGDTPLHLAVRMGRHRVVRVLVQNGACLETKNDAGETPFDEACRRWAPDTIIRTTVEELKTVPVV